jgi:peptidoglycan/xylan/chitin deacetylase (PgdA/CDA1 family)
MSFSPVKLIIKKSFIIFLFFFFLTDLNNSFSAPKLQQDRGIITLMYHRFDENKYPSTNIKINDFKKHIELIKDGQFHFVNANEFEEILKLKPSQKKILLTIDDAFLSFYEKAWPILKKEKIPFILFVSTREIGKFNYMNWAQIQELTKEDFVHVGNHSHTHDYLVDKTKEEIFKDINKSILLLNNKLGYNTKFFSYPFGEYSDEFKTIIKELGFNYSFGQHSGLVDITKDFFELPRFSINEKYGQVKRFKTLLNTVPFKYKKILPSEKYINDKTNPPEVSIEFYEDIKNIKNVSCYSNEEDTWRKSKIDFIDNYKIKIILQGKFTTERGRINCSLREDSGLWKWLGMQFVVAEK